MHLKSIELSGFKSFGKKTELRFGSPIAAIVGPNGSGKSNVAEAFRFVLGEQSMKSLRSRRGEDLIWGGSPALARAGRAAARVVFDNSPVGGKRLLDIDFPEVVVERVVYRDGLNEYLLNGTQVRLKDVIRLLAGANIGGSGYQIISQGEADRILNASPKERREMVEDALGLKLYQHKKVESERKLEETAMNIDKTKSLRREIAPHINFLRIQVEKIEKARELREELAVQLHEYFAREHAWLSYEDARIRGELEAAQRDMKEAEEKLRALPATAIKKEDDTEEAALRAAQERAQAARRKRDELSRELGRAEGVLEASSVAVEQLVPAPQVRSFAREVDEALEQAASLADASLMSAALSALRGRIHSFVSGLTGAAPVTNEESRAAVERLSEALRRAEEEETSAMTQADEIRSRAARAREAGFVAERERVVLEGARRDIVRRIEAGKAAHEQAAQAHRRLEEEVREAIALGVPASSPDSGHIPEGALAEDRGAQEKRRRSIERLKIKIEESGVAGGDAVVREFRTTKERDEFLAKELLDLEHSAASLRGIIADLEKTIDERFAEGLAKINEALQTFFVKLFGGGSAHFALEKPRIKKGSDTLGDDESEEVEDGEPDEAARAGLSIAVSLPRKKIHGLGALSGGERALTSIAMIFSMTQVNPPPFLILDETDAALDEANSRRYADMIRELGARSQLIVITHNRATMAAAGELFGVTMGADGVSKLLSVKLEEAEKVAK